MRHPGLRILHVLAVACFVAACSQAGMRGPSPPADTTSVGQEGMEGAGADTGTTDSAGDRAGRNDGGESTAAVGGAGSAVDTGQTDGKTAAASSGLPQGGQSAGSPPSMDGSAQGTTSESSTGGRTDGTAGTDPEGAFNRSLGEFDAEIAREREAVAAAGRGSGQAAETREAGDARAVAGVAAAGRGRAGSFPGALPGMDDAAAMGEGGLDGMGDAAAGDGGTAGGGPEATADAGDGGSAGSPAGGDAADQARAEEIAARLPPDIPPDGSGEDQVARQLREAALAEEDPRVREALWDQYRRHTGLKK